MIEKIKNIIKQRTSKITIAIIIIIITIYIIISCSKSGQLGNSSGNSDNLGIAVQSGKWIYYIAVDDDKPVGINKVKENGKKTVKIAEGTMSYLNIIDKYIYCLEEDNGQYNLIKIKTNGKKKEILVRDIDNLTVTAADKWVYYFKNNKLYRIKLNGTDKEKISDRTITYYHIQGNWIYYIYQTENSNYIARMKLNGNKDEKIAKADSSEEYISLYLRGRKIYYISAKLDESYDYKYYLYNMNKNGEKIKQICKIGTNIVDINMQKDNIFYIVEDGYDSYSIEKIKYNGTNRETIKEEQEAADLNITDDWIVFFSVNEDYDGIVKMVKIDGKKEKEL